MRVLYYPGCSLNGTAREYGESLEAVSKTLGVELEELRDWNCCGASSAHVSNDTLAVALAARNLAIADGAGMDLLVPCAACYQRLKVAEKHLLAGERIEGVSSKYEGGVHVRHAAEFFWREIGQRGLSRGVKRPLRGLNPVCYYGCLTARPPKITDAESAENPMDMDRLVESLGADVRPWSYKTDCCGGGLILTRPDVAKKLIQKLLDMAEEAGADCIVAACPMCHMNLDSRQREISRETGREYSMPVFYFTELMGFAYGDSSAGKWLGRHATDPNPLLRQKGLIRR